MNEFQMSTFLRNYKLHVYNVYIKIHDDIFIQGFFKIYSDAISY